MAYQNVGTPRFYINVLEWANTKDINVFSENILYDPILNTLPVDPVIFQTTQYFADLSAYHPEITSTNQYPCFYAFLGHDFYKNFGAIGGGDIEEIVNYNPADTGYKGFSIVRTQTMVDLLKISQWENLPEETILSVGSVIVGVVYEMPHSPELKLTMTREMDGVKRIRTKGGADLVDHKYIKPAIWGNAGAWELYTGSPLNQKFSRSGRRIWDLSFNHIQGSDLFGSNQSISTLKWDSVDGTDDADIYSINNFNYNLLTDYNFYSQVIHKTNGGQLPFIFQPNGNNANPDGWAICKFDMNSFKFEQVANGIYNMKLKIREVW